MGSQLGFLSDADPAHHLPGDQRTIAGLSEKCAISPVSRRSDRSFRRTQTQSWSKAMMLKLHVE